MKKENCWTSRFTGMKTRLAEERDLLRKQVARLSEEISAVEAELEGPTGPSMVRWLRANERVS